MLDGREHGGIITAVGRRVPEARAVYARILTAANKLRSTRSLLRILAMMTEVEMMPADDATLRLSIVSPVYRSMGHDDDR